MCVLVLGLVVIDKEEHSNVVVIQVASIKCHQEALIVHYDQLDEYYYDTISLYYVRYTYMYLLPRVHVGTS